MPGPSKVIVVDPDPRAGRQLQLGLQREGVPVVVVGNPDDVPAEGVGLVLIGGTDVGAVRQVRAKLAPVPIVFAGTGVARDAALAAGADETVMRPAYLRDVVTVARLLVGVAPGERDHLVGSLAETTGVYTLVRALAALGRSAVLTLIRGLRRGEVRFYHGEVTSAQVGLIHGQAALHQLLLWTDARFDFQHEDIVRRQQIPLSSEELFADAEHFLDGVRESAGGLSPAMVLEQDIQRVHNLGKQIPTEVHGVLRMFDGHRVLADVLEDSPYRVFETLRVAQKAVEAGLLRVVDGHKPKATWRAVLAIEEWLVGKDTRDSVVERTTAQQLESGPTGPVRKFSKKRRRKRRGQTPPAGVPPAAKADIDWGALVPRVIGAEVGPLSGVVPAAAASGEVEISSRKQEREGLEALMDTDKRTRIFPTDIGIEPTVVVRGGDTDEWERIEWEAKAKLEAEEKAKLEAQEKAAAAEREAAPDKVRESVQRMKLEREAREEQAAKQAEEAQRAAAAEQAKEYAARALAAAETKRLEAERAAAAMIAQPVPADEAAAAAMIAQPVAAIAPPPEPAPSEPPEDAARTVPFVKEPEPVAVAETPAAPASVADRMTVEPAPADTAVVVATPKVTVPAAPPPADDEPSDGVIRAAIATADTDQLHRERARLRAPSEPPQHDGPPIKETSGEIGRKKSPTRPPASASIADREPSILVDDLAAAHAVASAALSHMPAQPPPADAASPSRELAVAETRKDA
ncbi:MAG: DUF4388 domain-containing protein, partial [Acidobacteriota bacterium]